MREVGQGGCLDGANTCPLAHRVCAREKKPLWIGETTVVRLACESGFRFEAALLV